MATSTIHPTSRAFYYGKVTSSDDLNNLTAHNMAINVYSIEGSTPQHAPSAIGNSAYGQVVFIKNTATTTTQLLFINSSSFWKRYFSNGSWKNWYRFDATEDN